jgi:hypothetical protein
VLRESGFYLSRIKPGYLRLALIHVFRRELWAQTGFGLGKKIFFWRSRRIRIAGIYQRKIEAGLKFLPMAPVYFFTRLPRKKEAERLNREFNLSLTAQDRKSSTCS